MDLSPGKVSQHCSPYDDFLEELTGNYPGLQGGWAALSWELGQALCRKRQALPRPPQASTLGTWLQSAQGRACPLWSTLHVAAARGEFGNRQLIKSIVVSLKPIGNPSALRMNTHN